MKTKLTEQQQRIVEMSLTGATRDEMPFDDDEIDEALAIYFGDVPEYDMDIHQWSNYIFGTHRLN